MKQRHSDLVERAVVWLQQCMGCCVVHHDGMPTHFNDRGELPDVVGWTPDGKAYCVEVKTDRKDFLRDEQKPWRKVPSEGVGSMRWYLSEPDVIGWDELPENWGLLHPQDDGLTEIVEPGIIKQGFRGLTREIELLVHAKMFRPKRHAPRAEAGGDWARSINEYVRDYGPCSVREVAKATQTDHLMPGVTARKRITEMLRAGQLPEVDAYMGDGMLMLRPKD